MNILSRLSKLSLVLFPVLFSILVPSCSFGTKAGTVHPLGLIDIKEEIPGMLKARLGDIDTSSLPVSVDLSLYMPSVGDQGRLGSCVAFAAGYACKSYQEARYDWKWDVTSTDHIFSPAYIYSQTNAENSPSGGGTYFSTVFNLLVEQGCATLDYMPYDGSDYAWQTLPTKRQVVNASRYKAKSWGSITPGSVLEIKAQLASGNPVVIGIPVYPDFDNLDDENPVYDVITGTNRGGHALCVVGYDDSIGALKIINSWGTSWGLNGYGWISYNLVSSLQTSGFVMTDNLDANTSPSDSGNYTYSVTYTGIQSNYYCQVTGTAPVDSTVYNDGDTITIKPSSLSWYMPAYANPDAYDHYYALVGWSLSRFRTEPLYTAGQTLTAGVRDIVLYPVFRQIDHKVYYETIQSNAYCVVEGSAPVDDAWYCEGDEFMIPYCDLSWTMPASMNPDAVDHIWILIGWSQSPYGTAPVYTPGQWIAMGTSDMRFYPVFLQVE